MDEMQRDNIQLISQANLGLWWPLLFLFRDNQLWTAHQGPECP
jgi:hypothetical protein